MSITIHPLKTIRRNPEAYPEDDLAALEGFEVLEGEAVVGVFRDHADAVRCCEGDAAFRERNLKGSRK
jgi:hypothetical protein